MRGIVFLICLFLFPFVYGSTIPLLAFSEGGTGSVAYLTLETINGSGKIFIEANILMNTDTQMSIKLARDIVCSNYNLPCSSYDFYYTINGVSSIVTGPSGGAAAAVLTYAHVTGQKIPSDFAISGTINSGGFIGPVGGLDQKVSAAEAKGIRRVFVPFGNTLVEVNETNVSLFDFVTNIRIQEVGSLDDVLFDLYALPIPSPEFSRPDIYQDRMKNISVAICESAEELLASVILENLPEVEQNVTELYNSAADLIARAKNESIVYNHYSASSFCFSANLRLRYLSYLTKDIDDIKDLVDSALEQARAGQQLVFTDINYIQVHGLVAERVADATAGKEDALKFLEENNTFAAIDRFAYSYERSQTALLWSTFFGIPGTEVTLTDFELSHACELSLREAQDRIQYVRLYTSLPLGAEQTISIAQNEEKNSSYTTCILFARKAKAEADVVASVFGAQNISEILLVKQRIASQFVSSRLREDRIPLIGLSYIEYGSSLIESDPFSALLYFQLAQELGNIDIFFERSEMVSIPVFQWDDRLSVLLLGILLGVLLTLTLAPSRKLL